MSQINQLSFQVLSPSNLEQIREFELSLLSQQDLSPVEKEFLQWSVPWRIESLEHYLKLGWSFAAYSANKLVGYSLGQPFVFVDGQTQTLWVEHISAINDETASALGDICIRWGRDKHFQRVIFNAKIDIPASHKIERAAGIGSLVVKTTKSV